LFHAQLRTWDGIYKFVPNAQLWNVTLTNYTRNPTRLVLIEFGIDYENSIGKARKILADFAARHPQVLAEPPVQVVPLTLGDSSVVLQLRAWSNTTDFWATRWDLTEGGKNELEASGLTIPFPQHVIHFADPSTAPPQLKSKQPHRPQQSASGDPNRQESSED
jgi:small conductance mechanosensitive channel